MSLLATLRCGGRWQRATSFQSASDARLLPLNFIYQRPLRGSVSSGCRGSRNSNTANCSSCSNCRCAVEVSDPLFQAHVKPLVSRWQTRGYGTRDSTKIR